METQLNQIIEELQKRAKVCETASQDANEQALTGEPTEKEKNARRATEWKIQSKVWIEAEELVRGFALPSERSTSCI